MVISIVYSVLWIVFCVLWGLRSLVVRGHRRYAVGKLLASQNKRYKYVSHILYICQILVVPAMFWSRWDGFLKLHENEGLRIFGFVLIYLGLGLSIWSTVYLGKNYSPCYDSHIPNELIQTGPYRYLRHPGWLSKILVVIGTLALTGSLWFVPALIWIWIEMKQTIVMEEASLIRSFPQYVTYKKQTPALIPKFFY